MRFLPGEKAAMEGAALGFLLNIEGSFFYPS
jgi:hypothetical protein